jgi:hypothetical protein
MRVNPWLLPGMQKLLLWRKKNINLPQSTGSKPLTIGHLGFAAVGHARALLALRHGAR